MPLGLSGQHISSMRALSLLLFSSTLFLQTTNAESISQHVPRSDCRTQTVVSGDSCAALAQRCGISGADFTNYNQPSPCGSLQPGQQVCCSSGTLPSRKPTQNGDGTCVSYVVKNGDTCGQIAASNDLTLADLSKFNDKTTWAWSGCGNNLMVGQAICLSTGSPPLPPPVENAICGPTKPGTVRPTNGQSLADLNPCPLNVCCNKWGQCGTTPDFCTAETASTGNPGTSPPGKNGCISNCGIYFANMKQPQAQINVGYYESWNFDRPCLKAKITDLDLDGITHLHWAFADIDPKSLFLSVNDTYGQFESFKQLKNVKRILSIGGWGYSTLPATYDILRRAMSAPNIDAFVGNVIFFLNVHGLDGIDIDWEYPGAPDNQGVDTLPPTGSPTDGFNYWAFVVKLKQRMPAGKTVSIAAPSSYWYLKSFLISQMVDFLDYIVYMTYDLHGQWDFNNKWAVDGCPAGNCLRSHVNLTETLYALSMITKAGVPTNKIVVGISSYGRSFGMTDNRCDGPMCTYKGPKSAATPGECTGTPGYLANAEIGKLIDTGGFGWRSWYDSASDSDMLIYGNEQWVAYMSDKTRANRKNLWKAWQFAGTADWALSLLNFYDDVDDDDVDPTPDHPYCDWDKSFSDLDALTAAKGSVDANCVPVYTLATLLNMLNVALDNYTAVDNGYDAEFKYYITYMRDLVPSILNGAFMFDLSKKIEVDGGLPEAGEGFDYFDCEDKDVKKTACRTNGKTVGLGFSAFDAMRLTLRDENGYRDGLAKKGLLDTWVTLGDYHYDGYTMFDTHKQARSYKFQNYPVRNDSMIVPNPKDIITAALGSIPDIKRDMEDTLYDMKYGSWRGRTDDVLQVYSVPVLTILQAVDGMAQAKKLGEEEKQKEEKAEQDRIKNLIVTIISAVLVIVPFVGSELAAITGVAILARAATMAAELGGAALALYDSVENPDMAFVNVLGSLLGLRGALKAPRTSEGLAAVANTRRGMTDISKLGALVKAQDDKLQALIKVCKR